MDKAFIHSWRHIYADGWDKWARLGQIRDKHWGWRRTFEIKHPFFVNVGEKGIGHSEIFRPDLMSRFTESGHFDWLRGGEYGR